MSVKKVILEYEYEEVSAVYGPYCINEAYDVKDKLEENEEKRCPKIIPRTFSIRSLYVYKD